MSPKRPVQGALFGGQHTIPTPRPAGKTRSPLNDMDLIESVVKTARDPGYVLIGAPERVYRRVPGKVDEVEKVPGYEADAVHQLLTAALLTTGGTHQVRYGRHEGRATSVLLTRSTARQVDRWSAYQRPTSWGSNGSGNREGRR